QGAVLRAELAVDAAERRDLDGLRPRGERQRGEGQTQAHQRARTCHGSLLGSLRGPARAGRGRASYSTLTLALFTSCTQNLPSSTRKLANCSGEPESDTSVPSLASAVLTPGCCIAATVASWILRTIAGGVPAGTNMPYQNSR